MLLSRFLWMHASVRKQISSRGSDCVSVIKCEFSYLASSEEFARSGYIENSVRSNNNLTADLFSSSLALLEIRAFR